MPLTWNQMYALGTDVAAFLFYHPNDLQHRNESPIDWWSEDSFDERKAGILLPFCVGQDGQFTLKFVDRELTPIEKEVLVVKHSFRVRINHGRFFWDNSDCLPSLDRYREATDDPHGWFELPNGKYRFTINAMDWFSIPDDRREKVKDYSNYVIQIKSLESFSHIQTTSKIRWLICNAEWQARIDRPTPSDI